MKLKRSTASFHKSKQPEAKKYPAPFKKELCMKLMKYGSVPCCN
jgi:hypothetical protein